MDFYGLIGEKLSHSLSPQIHNKIFDLLDIQATYRAFEIPRADIHACADTIKLLRLRGINVTVPYKQMIVDSLDEISDEVKRIGAVNTIFNDNGILKGYNTDYFGFKTMLFKNNIDPCGKVTVVLGTGGSAQAVIACLKDLKVKKIFAVTRNKQMKELVAGIEYIAYEDLMNSKGYMLINTTPVGMFPNTGISPVSESVISGFECLVDLIYNPKETKFLRLGKELGKYTCSGLDMLIWQAIKSQEIWQNQTIGKEIFTEIYDMLNLTTRSSSC
jgi:shikimate dehydrogenase